MAALYQIRCRRCGYAYYPQNIDNRICTFCRKNLDVHSRKERLEIMINSIRDYSNSRKIFPIKDTVIKWIISKFEVNKNTVNSYMKELLDKQIIKIYTDGPYERVKLTQ